ncbi:MAG: hypothetical protein Q7S33_03165 [Nanoarchaeota archaeon]|nr:hypothetical protein [Nanoarchaeota archaeon]
MKKSSLVILIVVLLISLITGLVIYYNLNKTDSLTKECDAKSIIAEKDNCYNLLAYSANNPDLCEKLSLDANPPEPFTPETPLENCKDNVNFKIAQESKESTKCSIIKDLYLKERCLKEIGEETLNLDLCKIKDISSNCNNGVCEEREIYDINCVTKIGVDTKNIDICEILKSASPESVAPCYVMLAWKFCDLSICNNKIEEQDGKDYCTSRVKIICNI